MNYFTKRQRFLFILLCICVIFLQGLTGFAAENEQNKSGTETRTEQVSESKTEKTINTKNTDDTQAEGQISTADDAAPTWAEAFFKPPRTKVNKIVTGSILIIVFFIMMALMFFEVISALLALPITAVIYCIVARVDVMTTFTVLENGSVLLKTAIMAAIFGGILAQLITRFKIAESIIRTAAELAGDRPVIVALIMMLATGVIFTTTGGLGVIIILGSIMFPILTSLGISPIVSGGVLLIGLCAGGTLNPGLWKVYQDTFGADVKNIQSFALALSGLYFLTGFIFVVMSVKDKKKIQLILVPTVVLLAIGSLIVFTAGKPLEVLVYIYGGLWILLVVLEILGWIKGRWAVLFVPFIVALSFPSRLVELIIRTRWFNDADVINILNKYALGINIDTGKGFAVFTIFGGLVLGAVALNKYLFRKPRHLAALVVSVAATGIIRSILAPSSATLSVYDIAPALLFNAIKYSTALGILCYFLVLGWGRTLGDSKTRLLALASPIIPLVAILGFDVPVIPAFIIGMVYTFITGMKGPEDRKMFTRALIEGTETVIPAVLLMIGIGILVTTVMHPNIKSILEPLLSNVIPHSRLTYIIFFGILAPLALYRGPLNVWGMGAGLGGIMLGLNALPPMAIIGMFMSVGAIQGVCDPTNTHNVWIANYLKTDVLDFTKKLLPYIWALAIIGLFVITLMYFGSVSA